MATKKPDFGPIARRFLAGELTRGEAAALIFSEFEKARGTNATLDFTIDFNNPELSDRDRSKLGDLFTDLQEVALNRFARPGGTA